MGKIIEADPWILLPTQVFLTTESLKDFRLAHQMGRESLTLPAIVKLIGRDILIVHGHNRSSIALVLGKPARLYAPESPNDFLDPQNFPYVRPELIEHENRYIQHRLPLAEELALETARYGIYGLPELVRRHASQVYGAVFGWQERP